MEESIITPQMYNNMNLPITPQIVQMMLKAQKSLQPVPENPTLKERFVGLPGTLMAKGNELNRFLTDKKKLEEIGNNIKSKAKTSIKNIGDIKLSDQELTGAIAGVASTGLNALRIGERNYEDVKRPGYTFDGMAAGATLGANPLLVGATGGLSIAAGAAIGGIVDATKFIKGNQQFKKDKYVTRMKKQQDVLDINKFDYTGLAQ